MFMKEKKDYPHVLWITLWTALGQPCAAAVAATLAAAGQKTAIFEKHNKFNELSVEQCLCLARRRRGTGRYDGFCTTVHNSAGPSPHPRWRSRAASGCQDMRQPSAWRRLPGHGRVLQTGSQKWRNRLSGIGIAGCLLFLWITLCVLFRQRCPQRPAAHRVGPLESRSILEKILLNQLNTTFQQRASSAGPVLPAGMATSVVAVHNGRGAGIGAQAAPVLAELPAAGLSSRGAAWPWR